MFPASRAVVRCHRWSERRRCAAVVADIWRTGSGLEERFAGPLAPGFRWPVGSVKARQAPGRFSRPSGLAIARTGGFTEGTYDVSYLPPPSIRKTISMTFARV